MKTSSGIIDDQKQKLRGEGTVRYYTPEVQKKDGGKLLSEPTN